MKSTGTTGRSIKVFIALILVAASLSIFSGAPLAAGEYEWEWQNPLPQGNTLYAVDSLDASNVWAVGEYGTILHYNGATWSPMESGVTTTLRGVSAYDSSHVWAVGDSGVILFYNGVSWQAQTSGVSSTLRGVSAYDTTHIWAVGDGGAIRFNNGASAIWSIQASSVTVTLTSVSAYDASNVWVSGAGGTILFYDGISWSSPEKGTGYTDNLAGISAADTRPKCKVSASSGSGGTINPDTDNQWVFSGGTAVVDIIPNTGYYISSISDNGVPKPLADPYVVNNVTVNHTVTVVFSAYPATYTIDAFVSGENGTAEPVSQTVYSGSSAVIDFTPDAGYRVGSITDNSATMPVTNPYTISAVTAAHTVVVTFTDEAPPTDTYEVTASVTGGNGTVDPFYQLIDSGADATIDIGAEAGSHIDSITDNGVPQTITDPDVMSYVISGVTEGHDVEVAFAVNNADYEVLAAVSGGNGSVSPASQDIISGEDATIDITPDPGYHILRITDSGSARAITNPYIIDNVIADHAVTVTFAQDSHVWTVGADGRVLFYDGNPNWPWTDDNKWHNQVSGTFDYLRGVSALDAGNAWAVGPEGDIINWNGSDWNPQASGTTNQLWGISALDTTHVWAVGQYGTILFYDGTSWAAQSSGSTSQLNGVSALDTTHVWAVGAGGTILFYDGSSWAAQTSGTSNDLYGVSALDTTHVWAVGADGTILFFDGTSWISQPGGTSNDLYGVSALDVDFVWAVGDAGTIRFYNGTSWAIQESGTTNGLFGVSALDAVRTFTVAATVSGGHGSVSPASQQVAMEGTATVTFAPDTGYHVASVSDNGVPVTPTPSTSYIFNNVTTTHNIVVIYALNAAAYTVGATVLGGNGTALPASQSVYEGTSASIALTPNNGYHLASITDNGAPQNIANPYVINNVTEAHNVVVTFASGAQTFTVTASAPGGHGTVTPAIQQINQAANATITITPDAGYHVSSITDNGGAKTVAKPYVITKVVAAHDVVVTFAPDSHIWAVGDGGKILFYSDSGANPTWVAQTSGVTSALNGVSALDSSHVWAVGDAGAVRFYNGTSWASQTSGTTTNLNAVTTLDVNYVWAAGVYGTNGNVRYYNNISWSKQEAGTANALSGVSAVDANHIWAVGAGGTILFGSSDIPTYEVATTVSGGNGTVSPDYQWPAQGGTATIKIEPDDGYHLASILDNGVGQTLTEPYVIHNVAETHNVVVAFAMDSLTYTVTASAPEGHGIVSPTTAWPAAGGSATITITPDSGYHVSSILDNSVEQPLTLSYTINNVLMDHTVVVAFAAGSQTNTVNASVSGGNGSVSPSTQQINYGDGATVNITPNGGYHTASVTDNGTPVTPTPTTSYTIDSVTAAHTVVVTFAAGSQTNTVNASVSGGNGSVDPTSQQINYGDGATVNITPNGGYHTASVTDNGTPVTPTPTTSYTIDSVTAAHTVVVTFAAGSQTNTVNASVSGGNGSVDPTSQQINYGDGATVNITPNGGYHTASVTDNGTPVTPTPTTSYTIGSVTENHTVVVTFVVNPPSYDVNASVSGGNGSVNPASQQVEQGSPATITITPNSGYHTASVTDNGTPVTPTPTTSYVINNVTAAHTVVATFAINTYDISAQAGEGGSITPSGNVPVNHGADQAFTITPSAGYQIDEVLVDSVSQGAVTSYTFQDVTAAHTISASFEEDTSPLAVWYLAEGSTNWGFDCYVSIENPNATAVNVKLTYMTLSGPVTGPTVSMMPRSQATVYPSSTVGAADFSTKVECLEGKLISVDRTMYWTGAGAPCPEAHCATGVTAPATTWYMPEGSSNWGFECWVLIQNPNAQAANCTVTWMIEGASPASNVFIVPANSRSSYNMADSIGARDASIKVTSDRPVIAERAMYRNNRREGHDSGGTTTAASDYYLAEGCTGFGFTTYILVQNPQSTPTDVTVTYQAPTGPVTGPSFKMPANSRKTINVNDTTAIPGPDPSFSTHVQGSQPIIAERAMYWNGGADWGQVCHDSIGLDQPHTSWYLADGQTSDGAETWTLVQNPNETAVTVQVTYMTSDGNGNVTRTENIPAGSRMSFNMASHSGINGRAAIMVASTTAGKKIMVERAMYWFNKGAGTDTVGGYSD